MFARSMGEAGQLMASALLAMLLLIALVSLPTWLLGVRCSLCDPKLTPMVLNRRRGTLHMLQLEWPLAPGLDSLHDLMRFVPRWLRHLRRAFGPTPLVLIDCPWSHIEAEYRVCTYRGNASKMAIHSVHLVLRDPAMPQRILGTFLLCERQISSGETKPLPQLLGHWEYVRRFMVGDDLPQQAGETRFPRDIAETAQFELGYEWLLWVPVTAWSAHYLWRHGISGGDPIWAVFALIGAAFCATLILPLPFTALAYRAAPDVCLPPDVLGASADGIAPP
jgi:hypothetical protein